VIELTVGEVAAAVGAELRAGDPEAVVTSVVADSRAVQPGALFVALPGTRVDGHQHVLPAWQAGAVAALTNRDVPPAPCLAVADPLEALGRVARRVVDRGMAGGLQVVGITGSQGKTSTKDLLAQVLEAVGPTVAPVGNLNNELGVPLTACRLEPATRFLVAELGARGVGHIAYLCGIVAPRVGVVLNVGQAHVGEFGGQDAIARAKGELVESLPATGRAVLNADDPLVWAMRQRTVAPVLAFSGSGRPPPDGPAVWVSDVRADRLGRHAFRLHSRDDIGGATSAEVALQVTGRHQVPNAAAAAAAAVALGLELDAVAASLSAAGTRSRWRMELHERPDGVVVVNDAYNANPDSMRAAVGTLVELGKASDGRTVAVVGDMLELGATAESEHADLGRHLAASRVDSVLALGEYARTVVDAAVAAGLHPTQARALAGKEEALAVLRSELRPGDVVLVKASRGLALDTVAEALVAPDAVPGRAETPSATREEPA
jgi:UDP-N-acetylmuramoyl-tripeptide--D-alanyl-D-alanine ligase